MSEQTITVELSKSDAEVLLGLLSAERHNPEVDAVCEALRQQIDEKLADLQ